MATNISLKKAKEMRDAAKKAAIKADDDYYLAEQKMKSANEEYIRWKEVVAALNRWT